MYYIQFFFIPNNNNKNNKPNSTLKENKLAKPKFTHKGVYIIKKTLYKSLYRHLMILKSYDDWRKRCKIHCPPVRKRRRQWYLTGNGVIYCALLVTRSVCVSVCTWVDARALCTIVVVFLVWNSTVEFWDEDKILNGQQKI